MSHMLRKLSQRSLKLCNTWKFTLLDCTSKNPFAMAFSTSTRKSQSSSDYMVLLESLNRRQGVRLGLADSEMLAKSMGSPHLQYKIIHVAGTNGKGSAVTKIAACLRLKGYKVGTFTSPHLFSFRERFQINGEPISEEDIVKQCKEILQAAEDKQLEISFFAACTQIAFSYFASKKVDWAVLETGLGGRLDCTNIIESPNATVITSIGYDHMDILGNTLESIAMEKAGIMKPNCPVVIGPSVSTYSGVWQRAKELNCKIFAVKLDPRGSTYDEENRRISEVTLLKALKMEFPPHLLAEGLSATPPCRLQELLDSEKERALKASLSLLKNEVTALDVANIKKLSVCSVIVDVAHNAPGLERLCQDIGHRGFGKKVRFCVSLSSNREPSVLNPIVSQFSFPKNNRLMGIHYLPSSHRRSKSSEAFFSHLKSDPLAAPDLLTYAFDGLQHSKMWVEKGPFSEEVFPDTATDTATGATNLPENLPRILSSALLKATMEGSSLVICGSFFVMQQALQALDFPLGDTDSIESNETGVIISLNDREPKA
ncbi:bifunctional protein FolC subfamily protein [Cardiosporidium cionae]|uniref:Bifunctional protein FolC subfamily protein n=1 Tax=Cardiosporidium cionae TaxID=476202 RepID=A0ABQ7JDW0_9APIC|nr:bifunctional protein FolC subfamily protein [Cardiosporidium cionae]|eukprot:KAF8822197.1 bifunctional protein FolC subfamily protein [Cardiosporidium cionae]